MQTEEDKFALMILHYKESLYFYLLPHIGIHHLNLFVLGFVK